MMIMIGIDGNDGADDQRHHSAAVRQAEAALHAEDTSHQARRSPER